jgi:transcriptional regulator with XRE-family HTH domain
VDAKYFALALRKEREKADMTQRDLAIAADMSPTTLSALENKGQGLKLDVFIELCDLIGVNPLKVADQGYLWLRKELGKKVARSRTVEAEEGFGATPSLEEIARQWNAASVSGLSLLLSLLRFVRPEEAESASLVDRLQDFDGEPEPAKGKRRRRKSNRRTIPS